jgi:hypothetical protein
MRIGIDIDDTIADAYNLMFNLAQKFDIEYLKKDGNISESNENKGFYIGQIHKWNKEETEKFFEIYYKYALENVKPKMFSSAIINKLKKEGNQIIIISSRFNTKTVLNINEITKRWLNDHNIYYDKIYTEVVNKLDIIKKEKIDIMIDDDYYVCSQVSNYGKQAFLMNLESNRDKKVDDNVIRIFSWIQLYKKIKSME